MPLKIGVLMGGDSDERDVSISTGNEVLAALKKLNYSPNKILINNDFKDYLEQLKESSRSQKDNVKIAQRIGYRV